MFRCTCQWVKKERKKVSKKISVKCTYSPFFFASVWRVSRQSGGDNSVVMAATWEDGSLCIVFRFAVADYLKDLVRIGKAPDGGQQWPGVVFEQVGDPPKSSAAPKKGRTSSEHASYYPTQSVPWLTYSMGSNYFYSKGSMPNRLFGTNGRTSYWKKAATPRMHRPLSTWRTLEWVDNKIIHFWRVASSRFFFFLNQGYLRL